MPITFFSDEDIEKLKGDMSYLTTRAEREELFKKYAGIQLNNGQAVVNKSQEALKAAIAEENMDDANLASLAEQTAPDVVYRPLCSLDGDDGAM
jgi:hypothetical protein